MADIEKVIKNLEDLKERLKWQKDIQGYGVYIDSIDDALALLKEQKEEIEDLKATINLMKYEVI